MLQNPEQNDVQYFLQNGFILEVPKVFTAFLSKKKFRKFKITQPCISTLKAITRKYQKIKIDEALIEESPYDQVKGMTMEYITLASKVLAIAILGNLRLIPFSVPLFALYLELRIDQTKLVNLIVMIHHLSNYGDLLLTFRTMSFTSRTSQPMNTEV